MSCFFLSVSLGGVFFLVVFAVSIVSIALITSTSKKNMLLNGIFHRKYLYTFLTLRRAAVLDLLLLLLLELQIPLGLAGILLRVLEPRVNAVLELSGHFGGGVLSLGRRIDRGRVSLRGTGAVGVNEIKK